MNFIKLYSPTANDLPKALIKFLKGVWVKGTQNMAQAELVRLEVEEREAEMVLKQAKEDLEKKKKARQSLEAEKRARQSAGGEAGGEAA